jgi:glutathione S-transferase
MRENKMLVVHHLGVSQSERVLWVCEELGLPYEMVRYDREASGAAPPAYKALHFYGTAPVIQDGDLVLGESGAIVEYLCRKYGNSRLIVEPSAPNFPQYLYWFHFANGTFLPGAMMAFVAPAPASGAGLTERDRLRRHRLDRAFEMVEQRLGKVTYFAGAEFTAADIMMLYPLTTMRLNVPHDISGSPNTLAYLQRISARPAFQRASRKGDPDVVPKLT